MISMSVSDNTLLNETSTQNCVDSALDRRKRRRYRGVMARKKIARISGASLRQRRDAQGLSQGDVQRMSGISQPDISRIELEGVKCGENKRRYIAFLERLEHSKGKSVRVLQPNDDTGKKEARPPRVTEMTQEMPGGSGYNLPLHKARSASEGGVMSFLAEVPSHIRRPYFLNNVDDAYAFEMLGDSMSPKYDAGDTLYVNPTLALEAGKPCVFFTPDGRTAQVGILREVTAENWRLAQLKPAREVSLARAEWPRCERIEGARTP